ncbi:MAG: YbjN domain-containing protein [Microscillaceae bacterium]|nr:YbjN domain-containing protein [Microscillaceae bacterium]
MNQIPVFEESFLQPMTSVINSDYWGTVMKTYEEKKFRESFYAVLDYIQEGLSSKALDEGKTRYSFPHGSIVVNLEIRDEHLYIDAPFLRIPAKYLLPLMRQVAELNFGTLVLAQIRLEENDIYFRYDAPLELCEPYKLYRVIEEICIQADSNDDAFIDKFVAQRFAEPHIERFSNEQIEMAWEKFQAYLQEALQYDDYYIQKRWESFGWDAYYLAFTRIDYFMRPQGVLKTELEKAVKDLNSSTPFNEKILRGRKAAEKLLKLEKEKFAESMYHSKQFISEKPTFDVAGLQNYLSKSHNTAKGEMEKRDHVGGFAHDAHRVVWADVLLHHPPNQPPNGNRCPPGSLGQGMEPRRPDPLGALRKNYGPKPERRQSLRHPRYLNPAKPKENGRYSKNYSLRGQDWHGFRLRKWVFLKTTGHCRNQ